MKKNKKRKQLEFDVECYSTGLAIGPAFIFRKISINLDDYNFNVSDIRKEIQKLENACSKTITNLQNTKKLSESIYDDQFENIFESQIAILKDDIFLDEIKTEIKLNKKSAPIAIDNVFKKKKEHFISLDNEYFRDRALDIIDLKQKLLHELFGVGLEYQLSVPSIIIADTLSPSDTIYFNRNLVLGFVSDSGGRTSHVSIMSRSLQIPYIVNSDKLSKIIQTGDSVIINGYSKKLYVNPTKKTINTCLEKKKVYDNKRSVLTKDSKLPATMQDGIEVKILANVEFVDELQDVKSNGGQGIGLYRTEGLFLGREELPSEDEQYNLYKKFSEGLQNQEVIIRTVDAGGDKLLKDLNEAPDNNPFLGWRGIRVCLDEPDLFKTQLKAIYRANVCKNIKILLPMISCINELITAKKIMQEVKDELQKNNIDHYADTPVGIMIETPAAAVMADRYLKESDFFSIGTNDLTQYTLAVDRTNMKISKLFNDLHPAVLRLIKNVVKSCKGVNLEVSICGELAGNPVAIPILIGLGVRVLSISPILIPGIKKIIRNINTDKCEQLVADISRCKDAIEVNELANYFFEKNFPNLKYLK